MRGNLITDVVLKGYPDVPDRAGIQRVCEDSIQAIASLWVANRDGSVSSPQPPVRVLCGARFFFQPAVHITARQRTTTANQDALQHFAIALWDPLVQFGRHPRSCPGCTGTLHSNGLSIGSKLVKGLGAADPDTFVKTRRWDCPNKRHGEG